MPGRFMHHHHLSLAEILDAQRRQPGLVAQREMHDRHPVGLGECLSQQHIRFRRLRIRLQKVAAVEHHRVHVGGGDELQHLDLPAAFFRQAGDVVVGDRHHLAVAGLVGPGKIAVVDHLATRLADALVPDASVVLGVHLVEPDVVVCGSAVHLDRHVHQPEGDRTRPNGSHVSEYALIVRERNVTAKFHAIFDRDVTLATCVTDRLR